MSKFGWMLFLMPLLVDTDDGIRKSIQPNLPVFQIVYTCTMLYIFEVDIFVSSQLQLLVENEPGFRQVAIYLLIH